MSFPFITVCSHKLCAQAGLTLVCSGVVGVRLLGRQPDQWRPQWYHLLVLNVCRDVDMTYNDRRSLHNIAGGLGGAISPQRVQGRALVGVQGAEPWWVSRGQSPWKLQRICVLQYLKLGLKSCVLQCKVTGKFL